MVQFFLHIKLFSLSFSISSAAASKLLLLCSIVRRREWERSSMWNPRSSQSALIRRRRQDKRLFIAFFFAKRSGRALSLTGHWWCALYMRGRRTILFVMHFLFHWILSLCHFFLVMRTFQAYSSALSTPWHSCQCNQSPYTQYMTKDKEKFIPL